MFSEGPSFEIGGRRIGQGHPTFIVAEISANHNQSYERAEELIRLAKRAGADAVKLQTYTPDTLTIQSERPEFKIGGDSPWAGRTLYDLYAEGYMPWEWQPRLKVVADELGLIFFSTPFDESAVDFLESLAVPAYKVASFENTDAVLLERVAATQKPVIMSTGMASLAELADAVDILRRGGCREICLLKCTSAYPAPPESMNLRTIPQLAQALGVVAGLSDHTLTNDVAVAAVALGAAVVEKHFIRKRSDGGPDATFSIEPEELKSLVSSVRTVEAALGQVSFGMSSAEKSNVVFRRSLFVVRDLEPGDRFTHENVRSIRPGYGVATKNLKIIIGQRAGRSIRRGTPFGWELLHPED